MVFAFFKKEPEKRMVARPAAVPRAVETRLDVAPPTAELRVVTPVVPEQPAREEDSSIDFSDFVFSESSPDFQIEAAIDPIDAEAEDAAVLFANGQDESVRSVLENAVRIHHFGPGERLWMMLFDFYALTGHKAAFEALGIEYARAFEKSPPGWRDKSGAQPRTRAAAAGNLLFKGELIGDNGVSFDAIRRLLEKNPKLLVDLSSVRSLDAAGCGRLLGELQYARKTGRELDLVGREALRMLLEQRVECGRAEDSECWHLLLELCQLQGQHDAFEEAAINYAVTFEVSPPSWDAARVAVAKPAPAIAAGGDDASANASDVYVLRGDIKSARFGDLPAHAGVCDPVLIDCSELKRMDFISAGALLNVLSTIRRSGKQIVFRHPNRLVAELFVVLGLNAVATIVFANN